MFLLDIARFVWEHLREIALGNEYILHIGALQKIYQVCCDQDTIAFLPRLHNLHCRLLPFLPNLYQELHFLPVYRLVLSICNWDLAQILSSWLNRLEGGWSCCLLFGCQHQDNLQLCLLCGGRFNLSLGFLSTNQSPSQISHRLIYHQRIWPQWVSYQ